MAFAIENALALQALRHGDHEVALQRFDAAERHVADASINDASSSISTAAASGCRV